MRYGYKEKNVYGVSYSNIEMVGYSVICFLVPMILAHPQVVVGIVVNMMLALAGLNLKRYKMLPVVVAPSLSVLCAGLLFGSFTYHLLYMAPFIWVGNAIFALSFKLRIKKVFVILGASAAKALFLFLSAYVMYVLGIVPIMFLTVMGVMQLVTALFGGSLGVLLQMVRKKVFS